MHKLLLASSITMLSILFIGGIFLPEHPLMWLAATSPAISLIRIIAICLLLGLLFTVPPRSKLFRQLLGFSAACIAVLVLIKTDAYQLPVMDTLAFLQTAILLGLAAAEKQPAELNPKTYISSRIYY